MAVSIVAAELRNLKFKTDELVDGRLKVVNIEFNDLQVDE